MYVGRLESEWRKLCKVKLSLFRSKGITRRKSLAFSIPNRLPRVSDHSIPIQRASSGSFHIGRALSRSPPSSFPPGLLGPRAFVKSQRSMPRIPVSGKQVGGDCTAAVKPGTVVLT